MTENYYTVLAPPAAQGHGKHAEKTPDTGQPKTLGSSAQRSPTEAGRYPGTSITVCGMLHPKHVFADINGVSYGAGYAGSAEARG